MLNKKLVISILGIINVALLFYIASTYGLTSINNWLLIVSFALLSLTIYRVLGIVEGYKP
jgi:hypothetical protein